jgi:hypothetical protein
MKYNEFNIGDRVRYVGTRSPWLFGLYGIVEEEPNRPTKTPGNTPVLWDGERGYYGCYTENLEPAPPREPDWEV